MSKEADHSPTMRLFVHRSLRLRKGYINQMRGNV